jgi:hypothetical protein
VPDTTTQYRQLAGTSRAASDTAAIVPAAYEGRIDTLLVAAGLDQMPERIPVAAILRF